MSIEFAFPPALSFLTRRTGPSKSVVQIYRCPQGHLSEIVWTAEEAELAASESELEFHCEKCHESRVAIPAEANSILAALGLRPR